MKKLVLSGLACAGLLLAFAPTAYAHGGQYRGPGDVVPPNPGGGAGGSTPGPAGPSSPGPAGPATPAPAGPATPGPSGPPTGAPAAGPGGGGPTTGPRGRQVGPDLSKWQFWWEFNKDPYINLRESIHAGTITTGSDDFFMGGSRRAEAKDTMKPTEGEILGTVLPAIKRALDGTDQRDIVSSCLIAMAKIGKDHDSFKILDEMSKKLKSRDQEVRETAALAMGISQMPDAVPALVELATDSEKGRDLCDRSSVDNRTRAFSCYGLGLVAYATSNPDVKRQCFEALKSVLEKSTKDGVVDRNIPVAAINGIRLVRPNAQGGEKDQALLDESVQALWTYYSKKVGKGEEAIQAHVPPAVAQLLGRGGDKDGKFKDAFAKALKERRAIEVYQSAVVALGVLAQPGEVEESDKRYSKALLDYFQSGKDQQARWFSLMSLGKIGGETNRNELLKAFTKGSKALVKPWAAMSLGVLAHNASESAGDSAEVDRQIGDTLHREISKIKNPETQAAIGVALGLVKFRESADTIEALLQRNKHKDELAGYLCIGLALMDNQRSTQVIRDVVAGAIRRPGLLQQAAIALGKMGDKSVTTELQDMMMNDENRNVAKLSAIASALGFIGDRRTIDPLIKMLHDESITDLSRAFAAVALGGVADKELLPWNSKIAVDMNYRAAVETLTNQAAGVLDIL
ncbi:MAG: HEAT repeat domain-containing protein [Planctomycetota bacterium]